MMTPLPELTSHAAAASDFAAPPVVVPRVQLHAVLPESCPETAEE